MKENLKKVFYCYNILSKKSKILGMASLSISLLLIIMVYLIPLYQSDFIDSAIEEKEFFTAGFYSFIILLVIYYVTEFIGTMIDAYFTKNVKFEFEFLILRKFLNTKHEKDENYGKVTDILKKDLFLIEEYIISI